MIALPIWSALFLPRNRFRIHLKQLIASTATFLLPNTSHLAPGLPFGTFLILPNGSNPLHPTSFLGLSLDDPDESHGRVRKEHFGIGVLQVKQNCLI